MILSNKRATKALIRLVCAFVVLTTKDRVFPVEVHINSSLQSVGMVLQSSLIKDISMFYFSLLENCYLIF